MENIAQTIAEQTTTENTEVVNQDYVIQEEQNNPDEMLTKFNAVRSHERRIQQERLRIQDERKKFDEERNSFMTERQELEKLRAMKAKAKDGDYNDVLEEFGVDYAKLTEQNLRGVNRDTEIESLKKEIQELRGSFKNKEEELTKSEQQKTINNALAEIKNLVSSKGEDFELIELNNQHQLVLDTCVEHYKLYQKVLPFEQAAKLVESYLEKQLEPILKSKKVSSKFQQREEIPQRELEPRTISNTNVNHSANYNATSIEELDKLALAEIRRVNQLHLNR